MAQKESIELQTRKLPDFAQELHEDIRYQLDSLADKAASALLAHIWDRYGQEKGVATAIQKAFPDIPHSGLMQLSGEIRQWGLQHMVFPRSGINGIQGDNFSFLYPWKSGTERMEIKRMHIEPPALKLIPDTTSVLNMLYKEARQVPNKKHLIFSPAAILAVPFTVKQYMRAYRREANYSGVLYTGLLVAITDAPEYRFKLRVFGKTVRAWSEQAASQLEDDRKDREENLALAHILTYYNMTHPVSGGLPGLGKRT